MSKEKSWLEEALEIADAAIEGYMIGKEVAEQIFNSTGKETECLDNRPKRIFISYARENKEIVNYFMIFLKPYCTNGKIEVFSDQQIKPGQNVNYEINKAIEWCDIALFFVSPYFMGSNYIREIELPLLNKKYVTWFLVSHCNYQIYNFGSIQSFQDIEKALDEMSKAEINKIFTTASHFFATF